MSQSHVVVWRRPSLVLVLLLVAAVVLAGCGAPEQQAGGLPEGYPDQEITFIVQYAAGGGSDNLARTIQKMLKEEGIVEATITVENREGGSGAVGQQYVVGQEGNNYMLMTGTSGIITNAILGGTDTTWESFTPIARLALDQLLIVVPADSEFETLEDLIAAAEASPETITWGGTGLGGEDSLVLSQLQKEADVKLKYVSFDSGGEVQASLLGGHVDVASANPNEVIGQLEAGELRPLAVAGEERLKSLPDVPTLKEEGYNAIFEQFRGVFGPPEMDPEVQQWWAERFNELSESERWQTEYIDRNMMRSGYQAPEEFEQWLAEESERQETLIKEMGLGKSS